MDTPFLVCHFLKKELPQIKETDPMGPLYQFSKINPATFNCLPMEGPQAL